MKQLKKRIDLNTLTREQARVEIAKDVLAALAVGKLKTGTRGTTAYLEVNNEMLPIRQAILETPACQVCAVGAIFAARVSRDPSYTLPRFDVDIYEGAERFFTYNELKDLEFEFEDNNVGSEKERTAVLTKQMNRIIANKGKSVY